MIEKMLVIDWIVTGVLLLYLIASTAIKGATRPYLVLEGSPSFRLGQWMDAPSATRRSDLAKWFVGLSSMFYPVGVFMWLIYGLMRGFITPD